MQLELRKDVALVVASSGGVVADERDELGEVEELAYEAVVLVVCAAEVCAQALRVRVAEMREWIRRGQRWRWRRRGRRRRVRIALGAPASAGGCELECGPGRRDLELRVEAAALGTRRHDTGAGH